MHLFTCGAFLIWRSRTCNYMGLCILIRALNNTYIPINSSEHGTGILQVVWCCFIAMANSIYFVLYELGGLHNMYVYGILLNSLARCKSSQRDILYSQLNRRRYDERWSFTDFGIERRIRGNIQYVQRTSSSYIVVPILSRYIRTRLP